MSLVPVSSSGLFAAFRGQSTADLAVIAADTCNQQTLNVRETQAGDILIASPNAGDPGVALGIFPAFCTAGNSGNLVLANPTAGNLDLASQDYDWSLIRSSFRIPPSGVICFDRRSVTLDVPECADADTVFQALAIPDAEIGDTVILVPPAGFPADLGIGIAGVFPAGTALVPFVNPTAAPINPGSLTYTAIVLKRGQRAAPSGRDALVHGTLSLNPGAAAANAVTLLNIAIPQAKAGDVGIIVTQLNTGVAFCPGRCDVDGTLIVPTINPTAAPIDPGAATYAFALFRR